MTNSVTEAIEAIARGEIVVVTDDNDRENEGDLICAAALCNTFTRTGPVGFVSSCISGISTKSVVRRHTCSSRSPCHKYRLKGRI